MRDPDKRIFQGRQQEVTEVKMLKYFGERKDN
jgi:hypothetical protein